MITEKIYDVPGFNEPFSSLSHLLGAAIFVGLGALLMRRGRGDLERLIYLGIYSVSSVLLLSLSGVYHMLDRDGSAHAVLARLDHSAIFIFIAGTFTPVHGILFRGWLRWGPLVLIWAVAITGVAYKTIFFDDVSERLGLSMYLAMGWLGAFAGVVVGWRYGIPFVMPLLLGGVAYSVGALADSLHWPVIVPGIIQPHEVFHIAVIIGACYHWRFIWQIARGEASLKVPRPHTHSAPPGPCDLVTATKPPIE